MAAQQLSHLRSQIESLQEELAREKEANRVAREQLKQSEESFDQKEEGYESQIMMLNTEIERQATSIESLRTILHPLSDRVGTAELELDGFDTSHEIGAGFQPGGRSSENCSSAERREGSGVTAVREGKRSDHTRPRERNRASAAADR